MKIKKMLYLLIASFMMLSLTSCKSKIYSYEETKARDFIDEIYEYVDNDKEYVLVDARSIEDYAAGHFFGFTSYDIEKGSLDEFVYKIESMHSKDKAVFIIDENGKHVEQLAKALKEKKFHKIYIYTAGYENLAKYNNNDFEIKTGTQDCDC